MAELPTVGGDNGTWGEILNEFLGVSIDPDGTLSPAAVAEAIGPSGVTPGTYGGPSAVPEITVSEEGFITTASQTPVGFLPNSGTAGAPTSGTWTAGREAVDVTGRVWVCTVGGTPGTWALNGTFESLVAPATGNPTTDTATLTAAFATGFANLPAGNYVVSQAIPYVNDLVIRGAGRGLTTISGNFVGAVLQAPNPAYSPIQANRIINLALSDLTVRGTSFAVTNIALTSNVVTATTSVAHDYSTGQTVTVAIPSPQQTISNVALTSNVATITTLAPHGYATGMTVRIANVFNTNVVPGSLTSIFDGIYTVTVTGGNTFTVPITAANVASVGATGTVLDDTLTGPFVVTSTPTANTFTYAVTHPNISSEAVAGLVFLTGSIGIDLSQVSEPVLDRVQIDSFETPFLLAHVAYDGLFNRVDVSQGYNGYLIEDGANQHVFNMCRSNNVWDGFKVIDGADSGCTSMTFNGCEAADFMDIGFHAAAGTVENVSNIALTGACRAEGGAIGVQIGTNVGAFSVSPGMYYESLTVANEVWEGNNQTQRDPVLWSNAALYPLLVREWGSTNYGRITFTGNTNGWQFRNSIDEAYLPATFSSLVVSGAGQRLTTPRLRLEGGTVYTGAKIALSAGWGSSGAVSNLGVSTDAAFSVTVTPGGTGIAANPTIALTFPDGSLPTANAVVLLQRNDGNAPLQAAAPFTYTLTSTVLTITFNGTPTTGLGYVIQGIVFCQ